MELTKFGHACVQLHKSGRSVLIDPGALTTSSQSWSQADAVLITHEHFDHFDGDRLRELTAASPRLQIYTCRAVAERLADLEDRVHALAQGKALTVAGFTIRAVGDEHHYSRPDVRPVENIGFLIDDHVLHPGDALPDLQAPVLLAPGHAPWLTVPDLVTYLRKVPPQRTFAIHDGLLNDWGLRVLDDVLEKEAHRSGTEVRRPAVGEVVSL